MKVRKPRLVFCRCLIIAAGIAGSASNTGCQDRPGRPPDRAAQASNETDAENPSKAGLEMRNRYESVDDGNRLGWPLVKNIISDQKDVWTSPARLRWADGSWLFPLAGATAGFLATDRAVPPALSNNPTRLDRYNSFSNYGAYALAGAGGGLYLWSKFSRDDHQRETGVLAGEAAINSLIVDTAFKYSFGRERPYQDHGRGTFFQGGTSFPSDHSALAWSIASVIAHEYPGPFTQLAAYGLATAVSASRVVGKQHFPSDVAVGGAIGWLIGREAYRAHHDPDLAGGVPGNLSGVEGGEEQRDRHHMGSPFVPLDSWIYASLERLASLGYIHTAILGLKPWTRVECARLIDEANEGLEQDPTPNPEADRLAMQLSKEFSYETGLLGGGRNFTAKLESVYTRAVSISGPPLTGGYHFGQTVSYDFGRPFERGANGQAGGSFSAAAGPLTVYVRAEYQHAPAAPALADSVRQVIAQADLVNLSQVRSGPLAAVNRAELLDTYAAVNLNNWEIVVGRQSLSWAPGDDSMLWSDNIAPVNMVRLVNPEPFRLPGFLGHVGPVRIDQFFGRLEGHPYIPRPFIYGNKLNFKPFPFLELGVARTVTIGGAGAGATGNALTASNLFRSFFGIPNPAIHSVPGKNNSEMDWTLYIPKVSHYIVFYGDSFADDDVLPIENPARNPWNPGIYLTHIPGIPKLDFHIQGVSTENGTIAHTSINRGLVNYYGDYPDGYTNDGNLIGNTVGREGRAIHCWFTYWISPQDTLHFFYRHNTVSADFIPQGGAWQDYGVESELHFRSGLYLKSAVQYEPIARFPVLFSGPQRNVTAILEMGFMPEKQK